MLQEIFYWVFNMSITAALTGVIVSAVRKIQRIPRRVTVFLWIIPFFRMVIPFGLSSHFSLMWLLSRITTKTVVIYEPYEDVSFTVTNSIMAADEYFPITYRTSALEQVFTVASVIWLVVFLAAAVMIMAIYLMSLREIKDAKHVRGNVYISDNVSTAGVYGIIKPKIVLPAGYDCCNQELILTHEQIHIRRADNLWRLLAFLTAALHWFNPLCWIFLTRLLADIELSCDELVLARLGETRAKEYACLLLENCKRKNVVSSAFGGAKIKARIKNILSFRKITALSLTAFAVLLTVIFYVLLTNGG